jgi:hypothetical protein
MVSAVEHYLRDVLNGHIWKLGPDHLLQFGEAEGTIVISVIDDNVELDVAVLLFFARGT